MKTFGRGQTTLFTCLLIIFFLSFSAMQVSNKYFEIARNLEIFTNIYKELNTHYVDDLDPNQLMRTGIDAIMNSLDPYTVFYSESQVESYRITTEDSYNGLGADLGQVDETISIKEVYKGGAAQKAGIMAGDILTRVNGESTSGRKLSEVLQFIRGFPGTTIKLSVFRPEDNKTYDYSLVRSTTDIPNVPYSGMVSDEIGYVALTTFTPNAGKNIAAAIRSMRDNHDLKGLILDLRGNGGGLLSEAVDIVGIFVDQGSLVVSTRGKVRDRDQNYRTRRMPIDTELPLVVLVNKNSASASEIVSGAIQDYDRGVIMGQRTYGKGLVQNHHEVGYNSRIKVTTSKYYIPSGRCIQSVEYENGEPKDINDSQREVFYTKNGRPVLDGGGVTPDYKIFRNSEEEIIQALKSQNMIFKYANKYVHTHNAPDSLEQFAFTEYDGFLKFLKANDFSFQTSLEQKLMAIKTESKEKEASLIATDLASMTEKIVNDKADDLSEFKEAISRVIETELVQRYFYQKGETQYNLDHDTEIEEAISLLGNYEDYKNLLQ